MPSIDAHIDLEPPEAEFLFRHYMRMAIAIYEVCDLDLASKLAAFPIGELGGKAVRDFVVALDAAYDAVAPEADNDEYDHEPSDDFFHPGEGPEADNDD
jgi:hypothetical protein